LSIKEGVAVYNATKPNESGIEKRRVGSRLLHAVTLVAMCLICGSSQVLGQAAMSSARESARITGVRRVLRRPILFTTRYSRIHDFDVYFSLRTPQETYCIDYETPVLDEIRDLASSEGKEIDVSLNAKRTK
jgi:hypothetical protein